jgi:hypothetical protein
MPDTRNYEGQSHYHFLGVYPHRLFPLHQSIVHCSGVPTPRCNAVPVPLVWRALPNNLSTRSFLDVLVLEGSTSRHLGVRIPQRIAASMLGVSQALCLPWVPVAEFLEFTSDIDLLAGSGRGTDVEGEARVARGCRATDNGCDIVRGLIPARTYRGGATLGGCKESSVGPGEITSGKRLAVFSVELFGERAV